MMCRNCRCFREAVNKGGLMSCRSNVPNLRRQLGATTLSVTPIASKPPPHLQKNDGFQNRARRVAGIWNCGLQTVQTALADCALRSYRLTMQRNQTCMRKCRSVAQPG